ncbi:MAG: inositol-3-phosphate synthase [Planctomycetes bacterium]|nr:inositol-3-phosphate synthase [Planctomycetota bacterium]
MWLIGAKGAIATCVTYGLTGLARGWVEPRGIVTAAEAFRDLDLAPYGRFVTGGWDVSARPMSDTVAGLVAERVLDADLVAAASIEAAGHEARLRPGILDGPAVGGSNLDPEAARRGSLSPRAKIEALVADLVEFQSEHGLERVVVVDVSSTEAFRDDLDENPDLASLAALDAALDRSESSEPQEGSDGHHLPASVLYAYASFAAGASFVEFTPNSGSSSPALRELALREGVPHCGNDGKTGETLFKTALAPMFAARQLQVLTWQAYNMLGNGDGAVLQNPAHREGKLRNKDKVLHEFLGEHHSHVAIDFVPSLGDWKTAMDFVHFEGFLGARMSMQITWSGCDSALAAPLAIDLARLCDCAARAGEAGEMPHTAPFFKSPMSGGTHDFHAQHSALLAYAKKHAKS